MLRLLIGLGLIVGFVISWIIIGIPVNCFRYLIWKRKHINEVYKDFSNLFEYLKDTEHIITAPFALMMALSLIMIIISILYGLGSLIT